MILNWIPSFNAGEFSPLGDARTGLDKYPAGCRILKNFIPVPFGGASKRPGMLHVAEVHDSTRKARLEAFRFSTLAQYVMEFGHQTIRFIQDNAVLTNGGIPYVVASPYHEDDLFELQMRQINDVVFIVHPDYEPRRLVRYGPAQWSLESIPWDWPPMRDENIDGEHKITPSATTGNITLTSSKPFFQRGHAGAYMSLSWANGGRQVEVRVSETTQVTRTSDWLYCVGTWNAYSFNYWEGTYEIHRSFDNGATYETIRSYRGVQGDRNFTTSGQETQPCHLRLKIVGNRFNYGGAANYDAHALIEVIDQRLVGLVRITNVTTDDATTAQAECIGELPEATATHIWSEGAFSTFRGFPRTVVLHEGRVWYGGNSHEPMRIHGSVSEDFYNYRRSALADGAIAATIASAQTHAIQWLASGSDALLVGTQGAEFVVQGTADAPLAPNNLRAKVQSAYGSAYIPPLLVNYVTLFLDRSRLRLREFVFNLQVNGFVAADMTRLANHILRPGLVQWTFQQSFDAIVWGVTSAGELVGLTYEREENVVGWHRHETDGTVESVCTLYGNEGESDRVYVLVNRVIDGVHRRYIEYLSPDVQEKQRLGQVETCVFVDCSKVITSGTPITEVTGLSHLEGKLVDILGDGAKRSPKVVSAGKITLDSPASTIIVGLPYEALLKPMKADIPMRDGSSQARDWKLHRLAVRVFQSLGGHVRSDDDADWQQLVWRDTADAMGVRLDLFTGEKEEAMDSTTSRSLEFAVRSIDPFPFTVIALAPKFDVTGTGMH